MRDYLTWAHARLFLRQSQQDMFNPAGTRDYPDPSRPGGWSSPSRVPPHFPVPGTRFTKAQRRGSAECSSLCLAP